MFEESELLPISALQHLAFCERQWGLIHLEQVWRENVRTAEGRIMHDKAHDAGTQSRGDVRIARALRLRSLRLGLSGVADVVEFHRLQSQAPDASPDRPSLPGVGLPDTKGRWLAVPVEYKRGRPKTGDCDRIQLCAQALCLEEMLGVGIMEGSLFYGEPRRRTAVQFDSALRDRTERLAARMHGLYEAGVTPQGVFEKKCKSCSLIEVCKPEQIRTGRSAIKFLARQLDEIGAEEP